MPFTIIEYQTGPIAFHMEPSGMKARIDAVLANAYTPATPTVSVVHGSSTWDYVVTFGQSGTGDTFYHKPVPVFGMTHTLTGGSGMDVVVRTLDEGCAGQNCRMLVSVQGAPDGGSFRLVCYKIASDQPELPLIVTWVRDTLINDTALFKLVGSQHRHIQLAKPPDPRPGFSIVYDVAGDAEARTTLGSDNALRDTVAVVAVKAIGRGNGITPNLQAMQDRFRQLFHKQTRALAGGRILSSVQVGQMKYTEDAKETWTHLGATFRVSAQQG